MATLSTSALTLADIGKRLDPDGSVANVIELMNTLHGFTDDMLMREGNLPTGHQVTIRTGLPTSAWRQLDRGVVYSKSTSAQIVESCGMLESRSQVDKDKAELNGNLQQLRFDEAMPHLESMHLEAESTMIYGNSGTAPNEFTGLSPRYSSTSASNGQNILLGGGSGSDNTSVWLIGWGDQSIFGIYPKGTLAGLQHEDLGLLEVRDANGNDFRAYKDWWQWKLGLAVADWRYGVRIPNLDISDLQGKTGTQASTASTWIINLMVRAIDRIPHPERVRMAFYANRTVMSHLRLHAMEKTTSVLAIEAGVNQLGDTIHTLSLLGIPIRAADSLLNTESVVA